MRVLWLSHFIPYPPRGGIAPRSFNLLKQASLYAAGALALATGRVRRWKPTRLAGYFLLVNAATVMAWFSYLAGERYVTWQPTERN